MQIGLLIVAQVAVLRAIKLQKGGALVGKDGVHVLRQGLGAFNIGVYVLGDDGGDGFHVSFVV